MSHTDHPERINQSLERANIHHENTELELLRVLMESSETLLDMVESAIMSEGRVDLHEKERLFHYMNGKDIEFETLFEGDHVLRLYNILSYLEYIDRDFSIEETSFLSKAYAFFSESGHTKKGRKIFTSHEKAKAFCIRMLNKKAILTGNKKQSIFSDSGSMNTWKSQAAHTTMWNSGLRFEKGRNDGGLAIKISSINAIRSNQISDLYGSLNENRNRKGYLGILTTGSDFRERLAKLSEVYETDPLYQGIEGVAHLTKALKKNKESLSKSKSGKNQTEEIQILTEDITKLSDISTQLSALRQKIKKQRSVKGHKGDNADADILFNEKKDILALMRQAQTIGKKYNVHKGKVTTNKKKSTSEYARRGYDDITELNKLIRSYQKGNDIIYPYTHIGEHIGVGKTQYTIDYEGNFEPPNKLVYRLISQKAPPSLGSFSSVESIIDTFIKMGNVQIIKEGYSDNMSNSATLTLDGHEMYAEGDKLVINDHLINDYVRGTMKQRPLIHWMLSSGYKIASHFVTPEERDLSEYQHLAQRYKKTMNARDLPAETFKQIFYSMDSLNFTPKQEYLNQYLGIFSNESSSEWDPLIGYDKRMDIDYKNGSLIGALDGFDGDFLPTAKEIGQLHLEIRKKQLQAGYQIVQGIKRVIHKGRGLVSEYGLVDKEPFYKGRNEKFEAYLASIGSKEGLTGAIKNLWKDFVAELEGDVLGLFLNEIEKLQLKSITDEYKTLVIYENKATEYQVYTVNRKLADFFEEHIQGYKDGTKVKKLYTNEVDSLIFKLRSHPNTIGLAQINVDYLIEDILETHNGKQIIKSYPKLYDLLQGDESNTGDLRHELVKGLSGKSDILVKKDAMRLLFEVQFQRRYNNHNLPHTEGPNTGKPIDGNLEYFTIEHFTGEMSTFKAAFQKQLNNLFRGNDGDEQLVTDGDIISTTLESREIDWKKTRTLKTYGLLKNNYQALGMSSIEELEKEIGLIHRARTYKDLSENRLYQTVMKNTPLERRRIIPDVANPEWMIPDPDNPGKKIPFDAHEYIRRVEKRAFYIEPETERTLELQKYMVRFLQTLGAVEFSTTAKLLKDYTGVSVYKRDGKVGYSLKEMCLPTFEETMIYLQDMLHYEGHYTGVKDAKYGSGTDIALKKLDVNEGGALEAEVTSRNKLLGFIKGLGEYEYEHIKDLLAHHSDIKIKKENGLLSLEGDNNVRKAIIELQKKLFLKKIDGSFGQKTYTALLSFPDLRKFTGGNIKIDTSIFDADGQIEKKAHEKVHIEVSPNKSFAVWYYPSLKDVKKRIKSLNGSAYMVKDGKKIPVWFSYGDYKGGLKKIPKQLVQNKNLMSIHASASSDDATMNAGAKDENYPITVSKNANTILNYDAILGYGALGNNPQLHAAGFFENINLQTIAQEISLKAAGTMKQGSTQRPVETTERPSMEQMVVVYNNFQILQSIYPDLYMIDSADATFDQNARVVDGAHGDGFTDREMAIMSGDKDNTRGKRQLHLNETFREKKLTKEGTAYFRPTLHT